MAEEAVRKKADVVIRKPEPLNVTLIIDEKEPMSVRIKEMLTAEHIPFEVSHLPHFVFYIYIPFFSRFENSQWAISCGLQKIH